MLKCSIRYSNICKKRGDLTMNRTAKQIVGHACIDAGINITKLADRLGITRQCLHRRLDIGRLTVQQWQEIADALGGQLTLNITFNESK